MTKMEYVFLRAESIGSSGHVRVVCSPQVINLLLLLDRELLILALLEIELEIREERLLGGYVHSVLALVVLNNQILHVRFGFRELERERIQQ